jgi:hypothetical protein
MGTSLTEISTFGWFKDEPAPADLLGVSTFGWYVIVIADDQLGLFRDYDGLFDGGLWF